MSGNIWSYRDISGFQAGADLTGYTVEATDGSIGKVDKHSDEVDAAHIVVDTGVWIFGKHVLLPAGTITSIDLQEHTIYVDRTKEEIKNAPEFDKDRHHPIEPDYYGKIGQYYNHM
ncbi:PRC-barrel domain containing protein [Streptomyces sp. WAC05374]|uniref:PRC-barrel domain-containing protein n=1 Tax=Streptomyces sp. WAC05374 TaxID=2487420 RepID=UPI000F868A82|nr:PRC-barrel domain-containing protein [Streptomyces sp. WAC05374]RST16885.1 PRC-barrel domain containing protein [Streptomyces sp. WAC05374]TDF36835.1 PRC-barrel domain containing protein [Streptomyces sp. WAC05374]TDF46289.1 PRC-barrel domain containing protein [Streptomyces sp. WAC05374]TDF46888.1 PRC-barrel domain containing protein [Streptomyces sp. WAC05374]